MDAPASFKVAIGGVERTGRVSDGDTLVVGEKRIRLHGIDAPESDQICEQHGRRLACGRRATDALSAFLAGQRITCTSVGVDRYGRDVATCFRADGADVGRYMVASGWAVAFRRYSRAYEQAEAEARLSGIGLWAGGFVTPQEWRAGKR
jgi:endonuclease YncB( thermonuclease family)